MLKLPQRSGEASFQTLISHCNLIAGARRIGLPAIPWTFCRSEIPARQDTFWRAIGMEDPIRKHNVAKLF